MTTMLRWCLMCAVALLYACGGGEEPDPGSGHYASGVLTGLKAGNSVLISSGRQSVTLNADGTYRFGRFPTGTVYNVTATSASETQACSVTNGSGQIGTADIDNIVVRCVDAFRVGGTLNGYVAGNGAVRVLLNGSETLDLAANGAFHFSSRLATGASYNVTLGTVPNTLVCSLSNGSGLVASTDVGSVAVNCEPATSGVSFTVTGLVSPDSVTVQLNGSGVNTVPVASRRVTSTADGSYNFSLAVPVGSSYEVVVAEQAVGNTCVVSNGSGTMTPAAVSNVLVSCSPNVYPVSGTIEFSPWDSALLQLNAGETLRVSGSNLDQRVEVVPFRFNTAVPYGSSYTVTVPEPPGFDQNEPQTCLITNGSGVMPAGAVTNVVIVCSYGPG